jgi:hypothetical protein
VRRATARTHQSVFAMVLALAISAVGALATFSQPDAPATEASSSETAREDLDEPLGIIRPCDSGEIAAAIQDASRVELFQIDPDVPMTKDSSANRFRGYKIVAAGPILNRNQTTRIKKLLLDPRITPPQTIRQALGKLCYLSPHHALRMTGGAGEPIDVVICFGCGDLWVVQSGSRSTGGDFGLIAKNLRSAILEIFPNDPFAL